jgi:hypothetical protein
MKAQRLAAAPPATSGRAGAAPAVAPGLAASSEAAPSSRAPSAGVASRHGLGALREARIRGWSIAPDGGPSEVRVRAGGVPVAVQLRRLDRPDLCRAAPGQSPPPVGFVAEIDPQAWWHADARGRVVLQVELDGRPVQPAQVLDTRSLAAWCHGLAGWKRPDEREVWRLLAHVAAAGAHARLPRRAAAWIAKVAEARGLGTALRDGDAAGRIAQGARVELRVDRQRALELEGWALDPADAPLSFTLACNGVPLAVEPTRLERPDLERALHVAEPPRGFLIALPPAIWAHADGTGACAIDIEADGRRLLPQAWRVDAQALRAERAALEPLAAEVDPDQRAQAQRRLAALRAHAAALPPHVGWWAEDAVGIALLDAAFARVDANRVPGGPGDTDATSPADTPADSAPADPAEGAAPASLRANLEGWEQLILHGWAMDGAADGEVFALECNGQPVECHAVRTSRADVGQALQVERVSLGFEIQVPAAVWRLADARGVCLLTLRANGRLLHPQPLLLDDAALERALALALPAEAVKLPPVARFAGMRLRLTALPLLLEHVEACGGAGCLSAATQARLAHLAGQLHLLGLGGPTLAPPDAERAQALRRRRVWRLQRMFNVQIDRRGGVGPGVLDAALDEVLCDPDARDDVRTELLMSVTPLCCGDAALDRVARELPPGATALFAEYGDNWARSIHLAFLVLAGDLEEAAVQLDRLAEAPCEGWINTECIAFAVRAACDSPRVDAAGLRARAGIARAFARLLERLPGDAWSRLQDRELVEAAADLLRADGPWPDALADELVRAVLRCHALVPNFWRRLGTAPVGLAGDARVREARTDFEAARAALLAAGAAAGLADLFERLHAWHARGQRDALQWLRELAQQAVARPLPAAGAGAADAEAALDALLARLPELFEPGDLRRLELLPGARQPDRAGATRRLERRVATDRALLAAAARGDADAQDIDAACARLARALPALCTPQAGFRGLTALAEVAQEARRLGVAGAPLDALQAASAAAEAAALAGVPEGAPDAAIADASHATDGPQDASLWPTTAAAEPERACGGNRLRLVSGPDRLRRLDDARFLVVCVVRDERHMLPHFLAHHRALGATAFVVVDNLSTDGTRELLQAQPDVVVYEADTDYRDSHFGVAWQQAVLAAHAQGRWALLVDADELLLYPGCEHTPLPALLDHLDAAGHDAARTLMIDMYPRGPLRAVDFARDEPAAAASWFDRAPLLRWHVGGGLYSNAPTWLSALRHRLIPHSPPNAFTAQKTALLRWRPWLRLSEGLHYVAGVDPAPQPLFLGHYKYHAGLREKVLREVERKQHFDAASEYVHYLGLVAEPDASLFEPGTSVHLDDSRALGDLGGLAT